jgi:predicted dehydrogenase
LIDRANIGVKQRPQLLTFPKTGTERAELEHFAAAVEARRALALPDGDAVHNVALLEAIMTSIRTQAPTRV